MSRINRRSFLQQTSISAVAASATFALAQSKPAASGANEQVRIGVIGSGGQGQFDMRCFLKQGGVAFPILADVNRPRAAEANKLVDGKAVVVEDYRRMPDRKDIDAVLIATPDHWHAIPTIHACQAGKDVYVEKPMTYCIAEGRPMIRAARKHNRVVQCGIQQVSGPHYIEVAKLIQAGTLGKITQVRIWNQDNRLPGWGFPPEKDPPKTINWDMYCGPAPLISYTDLRASGLFRFVWAFAGGTMTDWGTHHIGTVLQIMNAKGPIGCSAMGGKWAIKDFAETPDTQTVTWEFPGEWVMTYTLRQANGHNPEGSNYGIVFHGTDGTLFLDRTGYEITPEATGKLKPAKVGTPRVNNFLPSELSMPHIRNFLECIKTRKRPNADVEIGHRATLTAHLGNVSLRAGRRIVWDPEKEEIVGDPEASRFLTRQPDYRKPYVLPEV